MTPRCLGRRTLLLVALCGGAVAALGPCARVASHLVDERACAALENSLVFADCRDQPRVVPRVLHVSSRWTPPPYHVGANAVANPDYRLNLVNDTTADAYVRARCGAVVHEAMRCLRPPAFRTDLFRYCALLAEGGVYMDDDLAALRPLDDLYDACAPLSVGSDVPTHRPDTKQIKILAAAPGHPVFRCALDAIVRHARARHYGNNDLAITGPVLFSACYDAVDAGRNASVTYLDTKMTAWPFTGMRTHDRLLAFEVPDATRDWNGMRPTYNDQWRARAVYADACAL